MRKIACLIAFAFLAVYANAATSITAPSVSGHWTLAGSPYNVHNDIQVDAGTSLVIDPGVQVLFQGQYRINVLGTMKAAGTSAQPITFSINDTTGFASNATVAGGWHGINYPAVSGTDSSTLQYCNITYIKIDSIAYAAGNYNGIRSSRPISIMNCNIFNNRMVPAGYETSFMQLVSTSGGNITVTGCDMHDNTGWENFVYASNVYGGSFYVADNAMHDNITTWTLFNFAIANLLFENNSLYRNKTGASGQVPLHVEDCVATIKGNKIYGNQNASIGGIACYGLFVDINGNLICNNTHTNPLCGLTGGGGGINLNNDLGSDSCFFTVRNNVIANNCSPLRGGGIYVLDAAASITNNQIINNLGYAGAGIYIYQDSSLPVTMKDNIFYGNRWDPLTPVPSVSGFAHGSVITFANNWAPHSTLFDVNIGATFTFGGDTSTNVYGGDPGLISPTLSADTLESALTANFGLLATSPCVDRGDTTGARADTVDYAGNARISGGAIDIGAYEYIVPNTTGTNHFTATVTNLEVYPNPASNIVFISTPKTQGMIYIQDMTGKIMAQKEALATLTFFDIHALAKGIYFALWNDGHGRKELQKVVVE